MQDPLIPALQELLGIINAFNASLANMNALNRSRAEVTSAALYEIRESQAAMRKDLRYIRSAVLDGAAMPVDRGLAGACECETRASASYADAEAQTSASRSAGAGGDAVRFGVPAVSSASESASVTEPRSVPTSSPGTPHSVQPAGCDASRAGGTCYGDER